MNQQRMIELRQKGETLQTIATAAGVSIGTVFARTGGRQGPERCRYMKRVSPNSDRDNEIRQRVIGGYNQSEVGRMYGLSRERIRQIVSAG